MLWNGNNLSANTMIFKRGTVVNHKDGRSAIINEKGEHCIVNDTMVSLWNMCKGISFNDLFLEYSRISSGSEKDVRESLRKAIHLFETFSIIKVKKS
jgi:hypothetical protein